MGFTVANGTSFCIIGERVVFLDVPRDRYFCLTPELEQAFVALVKLGPGQVPVQDLEKLAANSTVFQVPGDDRPSPCPSIGLPAMTLLDEGISPGLSQVALALVALSRSLRTLRRKGLEASLAEIARQKVRANLSRDSRYRASIVAAAFVRAGRLVSAHDRCLSQSLAVARRMLRAGVSVDVVLGVRLQPFRAHCWVQSADFVVNDRAEVIGEFTPILIV